MSETVARETVNSSQKEDPFNWPFPQRKDCLSQQPLNEKTDLFRMTVSNMRAKARETSTNLKNDDISGARPKVWAKADVNKPDFALTNLDIEGSGPRLLHMGLNKTYYNLTNEDIAGSKPQMNKFITTR